MNKLPAIVLCALLCVLQLAGCTTQPPQGNIPGGAPRPADTLQPGKTAGDFSLFSDEGTQQAMQTATVPAKTATPTATPKKPTETPKPTPTPATLSGNRDEFSETELLEFFRQVVIGDDPANAKVHKWNTPIVVSMTGNYNTADEEQLTAVFDMLNAYDNFPGAVFLSAAKPGAKANLTVNFISYTELNTLFPGDDYWYYSSYKSNDWAIYKGAMYLATDKVTDQADRNFELTWCIFYALGMINDSEMFYDSIFNPHFNYNAPGTQFPAKADWYLVSMLYYEGVKPGMTYEQAVAALTAQ